MPRMVFSSFVCGICFGTLLLTGAAVHGQTSLNIQTREAQFAEIEKQASLFAPRVQLIKSVIGVCQPSVVHIKAIKTEGESSLRTRTVEEAGAGVILEHRSRRFVLTNRHVIKNAVLDQIHVYTVAGQHANPVKKWTDPATDIAVLELPKGDFIPARFEEEQGVEVGDYVVAIGSPFGLNHSVTSGIVSALGRRDLQLGDEGVRYQDFIQTDAAINPGNSGGPLINLRGRVVGINTAIASNSGGNEGIGFSIPIQMVLKIARQLIDNGQVKRGFLGVSLDSGFTPDRAKQMGLRSFYGARISGITPTSPAETAKLRVGDVILFFDGVRIQNDSHLVTQVSRTDLNKVVPVTVHRAGKERQVDVVLTTREDFAVTQRRPIQ